MAKAQINASKAQIAQVEAALQNAETNLRYPRILSPVNGVVVSRNVDVGQTVAASFQTPTLFTIAEDLTNWDKRPYLYVRTLVQLNVGTVVMYN